MSVLINNMEMPKSCSDCIIFYDFCVCLGTGTRAYDKGKAVIETDEERLPNCPLVELPSEHGILIDASKFEVISWTDIPDGYKDRFDDGVAWLAEQIDNADTIVGPERKYEYSIQTENYTM